MRKSRTAERVSHLFRLDSRCVLRENTPIFEVYDQCWHSLAMMLFKFLALMLAFFGDLNDGVVLGNDVVLFLALFLAMMANAESLLAQF